MSRCIILLFFTLTFIFNLKLNAINKANDSVKIVTKDFKSKCSNKTCYVTLNGTIKNFRKYYSESQNIRTIINDNTTSEQLSYFSNIDSTGNFLISFPLFNSQDVLLAYRQRWVSIFVQPGDTLTINIEADSFPESIHFIGKGAEKNRQFLLYQLFDHKNADPQIAIKNKLFRDSLSFKRYRQWRDSVYMIRKKAKETFCIKHNIDEDIVISLKREEELHYYTDLLGYYSFKRNKADSTLLVFLKSFHTDTSYLTSSYYLFFIANLNMFFNIQSQTSYIEKIKALRSKTNSPESSSIDLSFENQRQLSFNCFVTIVSKLNDRSISNLLITNRLFEELKQSKVDLINETNLLLITDTLIKERFLAQINALKNTQANLNNLNLYDSDGELLLKSLKDKYSGRIIYIDLWATWCSPCFIEMKKADIIKKKYKNNEIVYVYLCCESDKNIWERKIKELEISGEHIWLNSMQYKDLYLKFNISGFPHYVLINRKGKIVDINAPRPSEDKLLIKEIDLLSKY
jgi:thiol-disulfide isomerase/thioredoxin